MWEVLGRGMTVGQIPCFINNSGDFVALRISLGNLSAVNRQDSFTNAYINKSRTEIREITELSDHVKCFVCCVCFIAQRVNHWAKLKRVANYKQDKVPLLQSCENAKNMRFNIFGTIRTNKHFPEMCIRL